MAAHANWTPEPGVAYIPVPRCDRCAHWRPFEDALQPATVGNIVVEMKAAGIWPDNIVLPRLGDCGASTSDGSKMSAGGSVFRPRPVETQHDFGCVMFEPRA